MKLSEYKKKVIAEYGKKEWERIENTNKYKVYSLTEEEQIKSIQNNPFNIKYIKNLNEELQLKAVKQSGLVIKYIDNPSEKVQLEAIKQTGVAIEYIKKPTEKVLEYVLENELDEMIFFLRHLENDLKGDNKNEIK